MIHVFTCATGVYRKLMRPARIKTFTYLFPNEDKTFDYLADSDQNFDWFENILYYGKYTAIKYRHICNLIYPFVTLFKYQYIDDIVTMEGYSDDDLFLYTDATSWCLERTASYWKHILDDFKSHDICYATNPSINNPKIYDEFDVRSKHYVPIETFESDKDAWCQASFMAGKISGLKKLVDSINQLMLDDIMYSEKSARVKQCILPNFMEQHYANYIFYNQKDFGIDAHHGWYIGGPGSTNTSIMLEAHHDNGEQKSKRNIRRYIRGV